MKKIIVMNSKGGCGKTTIATNLASYYASKGFKTALFDHDPQGSSTEWLRLRSVDMPEIYGVVGHRARMNHRATQAWQLRAPIGVQRIVLDMPGGLRAQELAQYVKNVSAVIIPVLPSSIDIAATARFIQELMLATRIRMNKTPVFLVGNRVRKRADTYQKLKTFLNELDIPVLVNLRDSLDYVRAAELGLGVHEMTNNSVQRERKHWDKIIEEVESSLKLSSTDNIALYG